MEVPIRCHLVGFFFAYTEQFKGLTTSLLNMAVWNLASPHPPWNAIFRVVSYPNTVFGLRIGSSEEVGKIVVYVPYASKFKSW